MYEVKKEIKKINKEPVETFVRDVEEDDCCLEVEAGTTGFCGGGRESGSRAYVRIEGTKADMYAGITESEGGVEIAVCGDEEIFAVIKALHFAERALVEGCIKAL